MSRENVKLVRRAYDAFERLDVDAVVGLVTDDFEFDISAHPVPDFPNRGRGADHMRRFFGTYLSGFTAYQVEVTEMVEREDTVVAALHDTASLGTAVVERDFAHVWTFRDGVPMRLQAFTTMKEAFEATEPRE
jgi:ketosteroid isomerase-like protein